MSCPHRPLPHSLRLPIAGLLALALVASLSAGAWANHTMPTCFGQTPTVVGTNGADTFSDTDPEDPLRAGDVLLSLGGADRVTLEGNTPRLLICTGAGQDSVVSEDAGGEGGVSINGQAGADRIYDRSYARPPTGHRMRLYGGPGADFLRGGPANDKIAGGSGPDRASGAYGNDFIRMGRGRDRAEGTAGADRIGGGPGHDVLSGGYLISDPGRPDVGTDRVGGGPGRDKCWAEETRACEAP